MVQRAHGLAAGRLDAPDAAQPPGRAGRRARRRGHAPGDAAAAAPARAAPRELAAWQERLANGQAGIDRHRKRVATVRPPGDVHLAVSIVETKRCAKERAAAHASVVHDVIAREYSDAHAWMDTWSQISPSLVPSDETEHWQRQPAERRANAAHVLAQRDAGRERRASSASTTTSPASRWATRRRSRRPRAAAR